MARNQRDEPVIAINFTNFTEDLDMDCNGAVAVVADTFATYVKSLQDAGQVGGTTA